MASTSSTANPGQGQGDRSARARSRSLDPSAVTIGAQPYRSILTPPDTPAVLNTGGTMISPAQSLDLFVLTFNCAKTIINVDVFARHLRGALLQRHGDVPAATDETTEGLRDAVELPDLVVFSLQEIAPLTYGYLGGQLLSPYLTPFNEALNMAALELEQQAKTASSTGSHPSKALQRSKSTLTGMFRKRPDYPYKLIEARNVGMTAVMLFARRPDAIHNVQFAECAFGIANMGNKGALALRVTYADAGSTEEGDSQRSSSVATPALEGRRTAEITFVATHLAAMEYNLRRRNANWASIVSSCLFKDPKKILPEEFHLGGPGAKNVIDASTHAITGGGKQTDGGQDIPDETEEDRKALLDRNEHAASIPGNLSRQLHDISIFKPTSHLFVAGDLNYRISTTTPPTLATFPTLESYEEFFERDQLTTERREGRTLHGLTEAPVRFPPTYKIKHLSHEKGAEAVNRKEFMQALDQGRQDEVIPWKWASHRWPGWCDRILFLDIPSWVKRRYNTDEGGSSKSKSAPEIAVHAYNSMPTMASSDHQPVFLRASVPLLTPEELLPTTPASSSTHTELTADEKKDPRITLPVPIDTGAFERRAAARRKEVITGMTTLFFSTKEGGVVLTTVAMVGLLSWFLYRGFF